MKQAKWICGLLAPLLAFSGCSAETAPDTEPSAAVNDTSGFVMPQIPEITPESVTLVAEGIYSTAGSYDIGIYPFSAFHSCIFYLYTLEPLPEDACVSVDTEVAYTAFINEREASEIASDLYPYYLFECAQGTDWAEMAEAYAKAQYAIYEQSTTESPTEEQNAQWAQAANDYKQLFYTWADAYQEQLEIWEAETQPPIYNYVVVINFDLKSSTDEVITEATLSYGGTDLTLPIGTIRLDGDTDYPYGDGIDAIDLALGEYPAGTPWGDGYLELSTGIRIRINQDVVLKDLYIYNDMAQIAECTVTLTSGGMTLDQQWTPGAETLELQGGSEASFYITFADEDLTQREYGKTMELFLEYEQDGETYATNVSLQLIRRRLPYEVHLWAFQGVDTQSYYQQYLNVVLNLNFEEE